MIKIVELFLTQFVKNVTLVELENIIDFYIGEEDYQRCASIRDIMHIKYPESINQGIED